MTLSIGQTVRVRQVQGTSRMLVLLARSPKVASAISALRKVRPLGQMLHHLIGYRRPFASFEEAEAAIRPIANGGHEHPTLAKLHLEINQVARPSDYPAMFHISRVLPNVRRVYDLGGSVGNLYYCYRQYIDFPDDLRWQVHDLPVRLAAAEQIAKDRQVHQLAFSSCWEDADGADLLIASGSLHYFATPLARMIAELRRYPRYILINRSPLTDGPTIATTQDGIIRIACVIHNRADLIRGLEALGYQLVDQWKAPENALHIPGYPDISVGAYSGMFLRLMTP